MGKDIYVLANLHKTDPWMCRIPLIERKFDNDILLQLITDLHLNFILSHGETIQMTLYKLNVNDIKEFHKKRQEIFIMQNYNNDYISSLGFIVVKNFNYIVNNKEKTQYFDEFSVTFSYIENPKLPKGKFYLDCPNIMIKYMI